MPEKYSDGVKAVLGPALAQLKNLEGNIICGSWLERQHLREGIAEIEAALCGGPCATDREHGGALDI